MALDHEHYKKHVRDYFIRNDEEESRDPFIQTGLMFPLFYDTYGEVVVRSPSGLVFHRNQPTQESLDQFYKESEAMTKWSEMKKKDDPRQNVKFSDVIGFIDANTVKSVLDVGCGNGYFLDRVLQFNPYCKVVGVEPNEDAKKFAKENYGITVLDKIPEDQEFHMTSAWGVFEHVKDPIGLAQSMKAVTRPSGYVVSCVPNVESTVVEQLGGKCFTFCPQHLWYFSKKTIARVMTEAGLEIVQQTTIEDETEPVVKCRLGLDPYKPLPRGFIDEEEYIQKMNEVRHEILERDKGYKIVTIARKV